MFEHKQNWSVALGLALLALMLLLLRSSPVEGQASVPCYRMQGGAAWVAGSGCEWEMQSGATLDIQSGVTANIANVTISDLTASGDLRMTKQTALTVTNGGTITPTGSYQPLTAAGAVGTDAIATGTAGDLLVLVNAGSNTITLTDTGTLKLSGDAALGQYDSITLIADGTNWIEVAQADN